MLKRTYRPPTTGGNEPERFPDFPPRTDMQNFLHLHRQGHSILLKRLFGNPETTLVICETPIYLYITRSRDVRIPDLMIAFNVDAQLVIDQGGYAISHQDKPTEFVMEVASPINPRNDLARKFRDYQSFGIPEYWRFDPTNGRRYDTGLAGDRLTGGAYQPIPIQHNPGEDLYWGHSQALGIDICWQAGELLWWDPATQTYLTTVDEQLDALAEATLRADEERQSRRIVEQQAEQERQSRLAAEDRIRQLEEELRRSRGE